MAQPRCMRCARVATCTELGRGGGATAEGRSATNKVSSPPSVPMHSFLAPVPSVAALQAALYCSVTQRLSATRSQAVC